MWCLLTGAILDVKVKGHPCIYKLAHCQGQSLAYMQKSSHGDIKIRILFVHILQVIPFSLMLQSHQTIQYRQTEQKRYSPDSLGTWI